MDDVLKDGMTVDDWRDAVDGRDNRKKEYHEVHGVGEWVEFLDRFDLEATKFWNADWYSEQLSKL